MDFGALPPEINSARMYAGSGSESLAAAAAAWDNLAAGLHTTAASYRSVIAGLTVGRWLGPASLAMASAFGPYVAWTAGVAARAEEAAGQARFAVESYEAAFTMTVPPEAVTANRIQLSSLMATNLFGQNSPAIAANEAQYVEMWAQDAAAMFEYAAKSSEASVLTLFTSAPEVTSPSGAAGQAAAVAGASVTQQSSLASIVSSIPTTLQALASPASSSTALSSIGTTLSTLGSNLSTSFQNALPYALPTYLQLGATPLYGMSSVLSMAQTTQGLVNSAAAAAQGAASQIAGAAGSGASALGSSVFGSLGSAASLGPLSVPASWTSVIPTAPVSTVSALQSAAGGANASPSLMSALPRAALAGSGRTLGPRYGIVPTIMTRPPSGGYA